jgi:hypothetical protein
MCAWVFSNPQGNEIGNYDTLPQLLLRFRMKLNFNLHLYRESESVTFLQGVGVNVQDYAAS